MTVTLSPWLQRGQELIHCGGGALDRSFVVESTSLREEGFVYEGVCRGLGRGYYSFFVRADVIVADDAVVDHPDLAAMHFFGREIGGETRRAQL